MTLDEAIKHCKEKAEEKRKDYEQACAYNIPSEGCLKCAEEHEQLAEWLEDYKRLLEERTQGDLISREALKETLYNFFDGKAIDEPTYILRDVFCYIDSAPTVEITETEVQEVLNKRCMTAVANDYLVALHGKRPQADNNAELFKQTFGIYATEVWSMSERQFLKWLGTEVTK